TPLTGAGPRSATPSDPLTLGQLGPLGPPAGRGRAFYLAGGGSPRLRRIIRDLPRLLCPRGKRRGPRVRAKTITRCSPPCPRAPAPATRRWCRSGASTLFPRPQARAARLRYWSSTSSNSIRYGSNFLPFVNTKGPAGSVIRG